MKEGVESRYFIEAAAKVLDVLESFSGNTEELSITEIAQRTGLTYSTAFRLVYTLEKRGYIMRRPGRKRYLLTPARKQYRIGYAALATTGFQQEVTRNLVLVAQKLAVTLVVRYNDQFNLSKALLNADELLAEKIDFLIEYQYNEIASHLIGGKCHDAHVPAIAINFAQPGAYYFGGNNYLTGVLAGNFLCEFARKHWRGRADACLILPAKGLGSTQEARKTGLIDSLRKGLASLKDSSIFTAPPALTAKESYSLTKRILQDFRKRSEHLLVAALVDPLMVGAARAIAEAGMEDCAVIVGQGGARDARSVIIQRNGPLKASVAFFPESYGDRVLSLALRVLDGERVPLTTYTNHVVLTPENLEEYYPGRKTSAAPPDAAAR